MTSDQFFDALLFVGALEPGHALGMLLWLGAVQLDGRPLIAMEEAPRLQVLVSLPVAERLKRTSLALPEVEGSSRVGDSRELLQGLLSAWQNDVPLFMDS